MKLTEPSFKGHAQELIEDKIANLLTRPIMLSLRPTSILLGAGRVGSRQFLVNLVLRARFLNVAATNKSVVTIRTPGSPSSSYAGNVAVMRHGSQTCGRAQQDRRR